jgi:precorrin-6A synthase
VAAAPPRVWVPALLVSASRGIEETGSARCVIVSLNSSGVAEITGSAMRKVFIIGIGAGNPDYVTVQAINALNEVDVFFIPNKGTEKVALRNLRTEICERFIKEKTYRFVDVEPPKRTKDFTDYKSNVEEWHSRIEESYEGLLMEELADGECGAFLVWGDPTLYDSTLRIIEKIRSKANFAFEYDVVPGISSVQALAARHRIALNRIGESVHITTGRKLAEGFPNNVDSIVVLLDGDQAFKRLDEDDLDIYWGAYLGTEDEVLVAGKLSEVMGDIEAIREQARQQNGWIMDTYLLRKSEE